MPGRDGRIGLTTVGDVADDTQQEEEVEFDVAESFFHLVSLEMLVLDSRLVLPKPLDRHALFPHT